MEPGLPKALERAWEELDEGARKCLSDAPESLMRLALESSAASIGYWQKYQLAQGIATVAMRASKTEETRVLEVAARDLGMLVYSTAHVPQSMDGQVPWSAETARGRLGIEVKSHGKTVPTEDVDKFRRDLEAGDFSAGVFVSTRAPIAKIQRGIVICQEHLERGPVPAVYVSPISSSSIDGLQDLIRSGLGVAAALSTTKRLPQAVHSREVLEALVGATQAEISCFSELRKRLREAEDSNRRVSARVGEALAASQQRLSAAVATAGAGAALAQSKKLTEQP